MATTVRKRSYTKRIRSPNIKATTGRNKQVKEPALKKSLFWVLSNYEWLNEIETLAAGLEIIRR
jgi:hypothetical protein